MTVPAFQWSLATSSGIAIDDENEAWHSGIVKDVLVTTAGNIVVATDSGGVWGVTDTGPGTSLFDTDKPDMWCLAQGPDGPDHLFAGGQGLFETDVTQTLPLLSWQETPKTFGTVYRIGITPQRRIVVASDAGVFWADIPPAPSKPGCLSALFGGGGGGTRAPYNWKSATGLPSGLFAGLAVGPAADAAGGASMIAVAPWGPPGKPPDDRFGIFWGTWDSSGDLHFQHSRIDAIDPRLMAYTPIVSCDRFPARMYASPSDQTGNLLALLTSLDGGRSWLKLPGAIPGSPNGALTIYDRCVGQGNDGGRPSNALGVSPVSPGRLALGWRAGPLFSDDGGQTFVEYDNQANAHLHADFHAFRFDANDPEGMRLYFGSDGGLVRTDDMGNSFVSRYNAGLPTLQLLSATAKREWYGNLGVSPTVPGLIGSGTQDNGNLWCRYKGDTTPWQFLEGGDGRIMSFLQGGALVHYFGDDDRPRLSVWNGHGFDSRGVIPYVDGREFHSIVFEHVDQPDHRNDAGQLLLGIGATGEIIYGLFARDNGDEAHWEYLGATPTGLNSISAVSSRDGHAVFAGTAGGRMFAFTPPDPFAVELPVAGLPPDGDPSLAVNRIVMVHQGLAFASFNCANSGAGSLRRWLGSTWGTVSGGFPSQTIYGMDIDVTGDAPVLYLATDDHIYGTPDFGLTWTDASVGLPRRCHASDLRFAQDQDGNYLLLSTFGRSVWVGQLLSYIPLPPR
jgi:hypothetical protein